MKLQKRKGTCWLQADRRVKVDDKSAANALAGFSFVQMAPKQEIGAASSSDVAVAEPLPNAAEAHKRLCLVNRDSRCEQLNLMSEQ